MTLLISNRRLNKPEKPFLLEKYFFSCDDQKSELEAREKRKMKKKKIDERISTGR